MFVRFYGKSQPLPDLSLNNLGYLSSQQALADLSILHDFLVRKYNMTSKNRWISFGGSYSGVIPSWSCFLSTSLRLSLYPFLLRLLLTFYLNSLPPSTFLPLSLISPGALSAWFRIEYQHIVVGAVATSAPVQAEYDYYQYMEVVGQSLSTAVNGKGGTVVRGSESSLLQGALIHLPLPPFSLTSPSFSLLVSSFSLSPSSYCFFLGIELPLSLFLWYSRSLSLLSSLFLPPSILPHSILPPSILSPSPYHSLSLQTLLIVLPRPGMCRSSAERQYYVGQFVDR